MLAIVHACAVTGLEGQIVEVEVDFNPRAGIPSFTIVGLPGTAVKESRERVRSAIKNTGRVTRRSGKQDQSLLDNFGTISLDRNLHGNDERGFGLQFPNHTYLIVNFYRSN